MRHGCALWALGARSAAVSTRRWAAGRVAASRSPAGIVSAAVELAIVVTFRSQDIGSVRYAASANDIAALDAVGVGLEYAASRCGQADVEGQRTRILGGGGRPVPVVRDEPAGDAGR